MSNHCKVCNFPCLDWRDYCDDCIPPLNKKWLYARDDSLVGRRVKVIKGDAWLADGVTPYISWIAGNVPIGSTGTIRNHDTATPGDLLCIEWDHEQNQKDGYIFGVDSSTFSGDSGIILLEES